MCQYILTVVIQTRTCRDILRRLSNVMIIDFCVLFLHKERCCSEGEISDFCRRRRALREARADRGSPHASRVGARYLDEKGAMPPKYKMRCHYDILGVNRDANESELKRAYRKMALEWHPDKNSHRPEEAETRFKEVRGAYETLSDPNERAWYDSHREAILKAGKHAAGGEDMRPEDEINLMPYFTANAFRGFGDDPGGFYDTYSTLFTALDKQEQAASLAAGKDHFKSSPSFGTSDAPWHQVKSFYAHWGLFATLKTFAWADEYNLAEAQNRKVRRLMDEENKKLRRGEAREFNDAVRQLIAFVRKRDKRYIAHSAEQAKLEKARAAAAERKRSAAKKARQEAASAYVEADWAQAEAPEWLAREIEREEEAKARKEAAKQDLYCPVCKKKFKSQKQWENHEQSKQHKAAVQRLKEQMMEDEEVVKAALDDDSDEESDEEDEADEKLRAELDGLDVNEDEDDEDDDEEEEERKNLYRNWVPKDKSKNPRLASDDESDSNSESASDEEEDDEDEDAALARMMGHARTKTATRTRANADTSDTSDEEEEDEGEDDALERMMRTKRRVAFADEVRGAGPEESGSDSETESVTTVGRAERLARNKPRALLKKGKLNARKKDVHAPVQSTNPLHLLDSDSDMDAIAEGDEEDGDDENNGGGGGAQRASMFDVLDAEVVDDGADATPSRVVPEDDDEDGRAKESAKKPNRRAKKKGFEKPDADTGANMIRCQMCKLTFASGNALHKHLKDAHSGVHKKKR